MVISNSNKEERLLSGSTQLRALPDPAEYHNTDEGKTDHQLRWKWLSSILQTLSGCLWRRKMTTCCGKLILHLRYHYDNIFGKDSKSLFLLEMVFCGGKYEKNPPQYLRQKVEGKPRKPWDVEWVMNASWSSLSHHHSCTIPWQRSEALGWKEEVRWKVRCKIQEMCVLPWKAVEEQEGPENNMVNRKTSIHRDWPVAGRQSGALFQCTTGFSHIFWKLPLPF